MRTQSSANAAPLSREGAFVVQLKPSSPPDADAFAGRVEHVSSGKAAFFMSLDELYAFIRTINAASRS